MKNYLYIFCMLLSILISERLLGQTRYWVGDGGNWDDPSHWSLTSGGTGGAGMPTASDDAIFDFNSFGGPSTVTLPVGTFECNNIDFSQVAGPFTIEGNGIFPFEHLLEIHGSFTGSQWMSSNVWQLNLIGSDHADITTLGGTLYGLRIAGIDKQVEILDDINCNNINLRGGNIDLNGNNLTIYETCILSDDVDSLHVDLSETLISCGSWQSDPYQGNSDKISINHSNATITCGNMEPGSFFDFNNVIIDGDLTNIGSSTEIDISTWTDANGYSTFNDLEFKNASNVNVRGNWHVYNDLSINIGTSIEWYQYDTLYIDGEIKVMGSVSGCETQATLKGDNNTFDIIALQDMNISNIALGNIKVTGDVQINATGTNLGNCTNINFTTITGPNYYWVGGAGDINDLSHWATTSGGNIMHTCPPNYSNNLIFDSNSGLTTVQTITIPPGDHYCRDFIVMSGYPKFKFTGNSFFTSSMHVGGNIEFNQTTATEYAGSGNIWNLDGTNISIDTKSKDMYYLEIKSIDDTALLLSDLKASSRFDFERGNFNTNGYNVDAGSIYIGTSCASNPTACPMKHWDITGSTIDVNFFNVLGAYGSFTTSQDGTIITKEFKGGGASYGSIIITDNELQGVDNNHIECQSCSITNLTIDNIYPTQISGNMTITGDLTIVQSSDINFNPGALYGGSYTEVQGEIHTPTPGSCGELLKLDIVYGSEWDFKKTTGTFNIDHVEIKGIGTTGGATFNAIESVVIGPSEDWNVTSPSSPTLYWKGNGDWNNPLRWSLSSGGPANPGGCLPNYGTDVIIDNNSFTGNNQKIILPLDDKVTCKSLTFNTNNRTGLKLEFPQNIGNEKTVLEITKKLEINEPWTIDPGVNGVIEFTGKQLIIDTDNNVDLPDIEVDASDSYCILFSDLSCNDLTLERGTLNTADYTLNAENIYRGFYLNSKHFDFSSSTINVNGIAELEFAFSNTTAETAGATIKCHELDSSEELIYSLELTNSNLIALYSSYELHKFILSGNIISINSVNVIVDTLLFNGTDSGIRLMGDGLTVKEGIKNIGPGTPQVYASSAAFPKTLNIEKNMCAEGNIAFENIEIPSAYKMHVPEGVDNGGNIGIDFTDYTDNSTLYWIGGSGVFQHQSNWSNGSGACPTSIAPATASQLVFDNYSFRPDESTITFSSNVTIGDMLFTNSNIEADLVIPFRLKPNSITVDGGMVKQRDNNNSSLGPAIQLDEHLEVINGGSYTLEQSILHSARRPSDMTQAALKLSADSKLHAPNSLILISGHPTGNTDPAVLLPSAADIDLSTTELKTFKPVGTGQPNNDMSFDLGGHTIEKFTMDNAFALAQQIKLISNCHLKSVQLENGKLRVADGVVVEVD